MLKKALFTLIATISPLLLSAENQQTLSIIKPDGVATHHIGDIVAIFEKANLNIAGMKMVRLTPEQAGKFYEVHKDRPFYNDLVKYMSSGPVVLIVLEGDNAVAKNRELMGTTDPTNAAPGTIRKLYAKDKSQNAVHGSDSAENAKIEIAYFFQPNEIFVK